MKSVAFTVGVGSTKVLLQAGHDVVIFGCGSLSASVWAGQASLGFCLLSYTFISLFSSIWGRHSNEFPACSNTRTLYASLFELIALFEFCRLDFDILMSFAEVWFALVTRQLTAFNWGGV